MSVFNGADIVRRAEVLRIHSGAMYDLLRLLSETNALKSESMARVVRSLLETIRSEEEA